MSHVNVIFFALKAVSHAGFRTQWKMLAKWLASVCWVHVGKLTITQQYYFYVIVHENAFWSI